MKTSLKWISLSALAMSSSILCAQQLSIPNVPLISENSVSPNVVFVVDDSGSMDWEVVTQPHYASCNYYNDDKYSSCPNTLYDTGLYYYPYPNKPTKSFYTLELYYLFEHYNQYTSYPAIMFPNMINEDWRPFNSDFNTVYYNPDISYKPWAGPCSYYITPGNLQLCDHANFTSTRANPKEGTTDYNIVVNLDSHSYQNQTYKHAYTVQIDDRGFNGKVPKLNDINDKPNGMVDVWDTHAIITFNTSNAINVQLVTADGNNGKITTSNATLSDGPCYNILGIKSVTATVLDGTNALDSTDSVGCRTVSAARQNYADWYEYYRRRSYTAKAAISQIVDTFPDFFYGMYFINSLTVTTPVTASGESTLAHNTSMLHDYFKRPQQRYGTPLGRALYNVGRYFQGAMSGAPKPIQFECQLNNAIMLTDGYWNGSMPPLGDVDQDGFGKTGSTLADIARYYYITDLDTKLANKVPINSFDTNSQQHLNTYTVAFGVKGNLTPGADGWPSPALTESSNWGDPTSCTDCPEKIDDLWHAAFNSRGTYTSASNVSDLITQVSEALGKIAKLNRASLAAASIPSAILQKDTAIYQVTFNSENWTGELYAYPVSLDGKIDTKNPVFQASTLFNATPATNRVIITRNEVKGIPFRWTNADSQTKKGLGKTNSGKGKGNGNGNGGSTSTNGFSLEQIADLQSYADLFNKPLAKKNQITEEDLVNYLRGDKSKSTAAGGPFRTRASLLGDMVHSSPLYIGPPNQYYSEPSYALFSQSLAKRTPMVAVGSNDGMVHIFSAKNGAPLLSYVPSNSTVWNQLGYLAAPNYDHRFYVDGELDSGDVYFDSDQKWHTVLAGVLRSGGQGLYALDITEGLFSESSPSPETTALLEFNDRDDPDMGYVFGKPHIVKMSNNKWAIITGNGYNSGKLTYPSGDSDPYISSNKKAYLFILFIEQGKDGVWTPDTDYIKIPVGTSNDNGLAEVFPVDNDSDLKVDYIYAGDLDGKIYKFDVRDKDPLNWKKAENIKVVFETSNADGQQVITTPLMVGPHPNGLQYGMMVYFGTGKQIELSDNLKSNQPTQAFYGIWDENKSNTPTLVGYANLLQQSILAENNDMRASTDNKIDWTKHKGWYMKLELDGANRGEKVIGSPKLHNGRIIFTTLIPSGSSDLSVCSSNIGTSWLMELNASDGSRLGIPPYDVNGDGLFTQADYIYYIDPVTKKEVSVPHSGIKSSVGVLGGTPGILMDASNTIEYKVLSGSNGITTQGESVIQTNEGRQSWQEVY